MRASRQGKIFLFISGLLLCGLHAGAQTRSSSPYSIYGVGDIESTGFAQHTGRGNARLAVTDRYNINLANPATFDWLAEREISARDSLFKVPVLQVGLGANFLQLESGGTTQNNSDTYFQSFAVGIPVMTNKLGLAFGLLPYSSMGYEINAGSTRDTTGSVSYIYEGDGGISRVFLGGGYRLINDTLQKLSIGATASYLFGSFSQTRRTVLIGGWNSRITNTTDVGEPLIETGIYYSRRLKTKATGKERLRHDPRNEIYLTVAGTYALGADIDARGQTFAASYTGNAQFENIRDTILDISEDGALVLPARIGVGLALNIYNQWTVSLDYETQDWGEYSVFGVNGGLARAANYRFGAQYIHREGGRYLENVIWRTGAYFGDTRLVVNDQQLRQLGISFGLGIPIAKNFPLSYLNVGADFGQRANNNDGLIRERYARINFGLSLVPNSKFETWFKKRKIN